MATLFEYHNTAHADNPRELKNYLHSIWQEQYASLIQAAEEEPAPDIDLSLHKNYQPFLSFDGTLIRAKNYVGFIQLGDFHLEIYPKVFRDKKVKPSLMLRHLFFWFDYCRKWKFPFTKSNLDSFDDISLPELMIYLMASKMLETISTLPISLYQQVEESLYSPKGRINFSRYLSSGFITGNHHVIDCDHEPFVFDNRLNRAIKYVSRLLLGKTKFSETQNILQELVFILDEVDDRPCSYYDLETVVLNPLFSEYVEIKDICKIVLQQLLYSNQQYDLSQWCLLFPMEYIFEDFVAGFLENKFSSNWIVDYQKSDMNFTSDPEAFQMKHDILLTSRSTKKKIIVDTKYKVRESNFKEGKKKGILQADMYQVASYAFRRGCNDVLLLYPNINEKLNGEDKFTVLSEFSGGKNINIAAAEVPFWSIDGFNSLTIKLEDFFSKILKKYE
jgi:5-methylcytosine-specific restriction enzyme subunit McrC